MKTMNRRRTYAEPQDQTAERLRAAGLDPNAVSEIVDSLSDDTLAALMKALGAGQETARPMADGAYSERRLANRPMTFSEHQQARRKAAPRETLAPKDKGRIGGRYFDRFAETLTRLGYTRGTWQSKVNRLPSSEVERLEKELLAR